MWSICVESELTIDQGRSIYTLMDCTRLAGIMTNWKQSNSYPRALFSTLVIKKQLSWTNKAGLSKYGVHSSPMFSFFKWGFACVSICLDCYWVRAPSLSKWTGALFILKGIVEACHVWTDTRVETFMHFAEQQFGGKWLKCLTGVMGHLFNHHAKRQPLSDC